jgi:AN1-type zinc finger protein 1
MSSSTEIPPASYTAMDRDVEAIGAHCEFAYCHQLDFLPFRCESCKHTFCLDHRSETSHKCTHAGEWARNRARLNGAGAGPLQQKPTLATTPQCSETSCKTFVNTSQNLGVHCQKCNRMYCLKHRMQEDHNCKNLIPLDARPIDVTMQSNKEKIRLGFGKLKSWGKERQEAMIPKPKPTSKAAQLASLNALKKSAKGDDKLPAEKRTYLHVEAEAASTTSKLPRANLFFSSDWTIGRLLDDAAKRLQVANVNNRVETEEQRLRVYFVEGGRLLEYSGAASRRWTQGTAIARWHV